MDASEFLVDSLIPRAIAVRLIAQRTRLSGDTEEQARNRVEQRVRYAIRTGKIHLMRGGFTSGALVSWARTKWPGKFDDLPAVTNVGTAMLELPRPQLSATSVDLPDNLPRCHRRILCLERRVEELEDKLKRSLAQIESLRSVENWLALREQRRKFGKTGGRGHEKK